MQKSLINLISIPEIKDDCFLYFAQHPGSIPFPIRRIYFITKPQPGLLRGAHAHRKTKQILFCIQGKCRLVLDSGHKKEEILLSSAQSGLFLPPLLWHEMHDMNTQTILLVLASEVYDAKDYIRDYQEFLKIVRSQK